MKKYYHSSLYYRYYIVPNGKKESYEVTEKRFYNEFWKNGYKTKDYADRDETKTDTHLLIRYKAYLDIEDHVEIEDYYYPEEVKPKIETNKKVFMEDPIYWHNIKNFMGKKFRM